MQEEQKGRDMEEADHFLMSGEDLFGEWQLILSAFYTQEKHKTDCVQHSNRLGDLIMPGIFSAPSGKYPSGKELVVADIGMS